MAKMIKRGDEVTVISGEHKGKKGKVLEVFRTKNRIIVEGVNLVKRHERKTQDNPEGSIVEREASLHYSNIMLSSRHAERVARLTA
ncbi:MAG: 50S ribosomal protein L24 [Opitutae bacterium]|jgi:large subunit ribosomal protein L24|nr:50S ribosomal protein L24 [Opitutae bacterium]MBT5909266.1 50S ribosomal protein L24 [Opitutae bacterium]MBT7743207.1 50S ribosomal protein L24 [Opitutae bacterium]MBT7923807.1 50S ribosomal protein L24 [Opitutae bacterium]